MKVYRAGQRGDPAALLGCREIAIGYGYCSGQEAMAHFGLGDVERVDVEVTLPHGRGTFARDGIAADQHVTLQQP